MTLEQLEFILEVNRAGTIMAAADNLHISHTSISRAISNLETELGFPIFVRSRKGSSLTEEGKAAVLLAQSILSEVQQMKQLGATVENRTLKIGVYPISFRNFLEQVIFRFNKKHPNVTIHIDHLNVDNIINKVKSRDLNFGLFFYRSDVKPEVPDDLKITEIMRSPLVVLCNPQSHLARQESIAFEELQSESFILQSETQVYNMMKEIYTEEHMPNIIMHTNNNELIKSAVMNSNAIATYTQFFVENDSLVQSGELTYVPIRYKGEIYHLSYLYLRPAKSYHNQIEQDFIRILKQVITHRNE